MYELIGVEVVFRRTRAIILRDIEHNRWLVASSQTDWEPRRLDLDIGHAYALPLALQEAFLRIVQTESGLPAIIVDHMESMEIIAGVLDKFHHNETLPARDIETAEFLQLKILNAGIDALSTIFRLRRESVGLSLEELAEAVGVKPPVIERLELGSEDKDKISSSLIGVIAKELGLSTTAIHNIISGQPLRKEQPGALRLAARYRGAADLRAIPDDVATILKRLIADCVDPS